MKKLNNTDPNGLDADPRVILKFISKNKEIMCDTLYYFLSDNGHLIFAISSMYPSIDGLPAELVGGTLLEIPIKGLPWFINVLENKFFKTEAEGGLENGKFVYEEAVMGERLCVSRMFGIPGYAFRNYSRQDYLVDFTEDPQSIELSDELLFDEGLFDQLKIMARKIDSGEMT